MLRNEPKVPLASCVWKETVFFFQTQFDTFEERWLHNQLRLTLHDYTAPADGREPYYAVHGLVDTSRSQWVSVSYHPVLWS